MLDINPADVIAALESCKAQLIFFGVVSALAIIVLIAAAVKKDWPKPLKFMLRAQSALAVLLDAALGCLEQYFKKRGS